MTIEASKFELTRETWRELKEHPTDSVEDVVKKIVVLFGLLFIALFEAALYPFATPAPETNTALHSVEVAPPEQNHYLNFLGAVAR